MFTSMFLMYEPSTDKLEMSPANARASQRFYTYWLWPLFELIYGKYDWWVFLRTSAKMNLSDEEEKSINRVL